MCKHELAEIQEQVAKVNARFRERLEELAREYGDAIRPHEERLGRLWGRVVEHEHGYRAQFAYPQRLRLICQFCFWQESAAASKPDVVSWYARDLLVPMCIHHLGVAEANGMRPRRILPAAMRYLELTRGSGVEAIEGDTRPLVDSLVNEVIVRPTAANM